MFENTEHDNGIQFISSRLVRSSKVLGQNGKRHFYLMPWKSSSQLLVKVPRLFLFKSAEGAKPKLNTPSFFSDFQWGTRNFFKIIIAGFEGCAVKPLYCLPNLLNQASVILLELISLRPCPPQNKALSPENGASNEFRLFGRKLIFVSAKRKVGGTSRKRFIVAENEITKRNEFKSRVFGFFFSGKKIGKSGGSGRVGR